MGAGWGKGKKVVGGPAFEVAVNQSGKLGGHVLQRGKAGEETCKKEGCNSKEEEEQ